MPIVNAIISNPLVSVAYVSDLYSLHYWQQYQTFIIPRILSCSIIKFLVTEPCFYGAVPFKAAPKLPGILSRPRIWQNRADFDYYNPVFATYIVIPTGASDHASPSGQHKRLMLR